MGFPQKGRFDYGNDLGVDWNGGALPTFRPVHRKAGRSGGSRSQRRRFRSGAEHLHGRRTVSLDRRYGGVLHASGLSDRLAGAFQPLLHRLLPQASRDPETLGAVSANVSANLLGLGNAATPLGIRAARRMAVGCGGTASDELCRLVVLNTASIQLLPTTAASLRAAAGCRTPFDILPAVWVSSLLSVTVGLLACRLLARWTGGRP